MVSEIKSSALSREQRLHPISWLFILIRAIRRNILLLILLVFGGATVMLQVLVGIIVLTFIHGLLYYRNYRYLLEDDALVIFEGVLERTARRVPFSRIQNLNQVENPLHRAFSVAELQIESGSGQRPEAIMVVLGRAEIADLREHISKVKEKLSDQSEQETEDKPWLALSWRDLVSYGLISLHGWIPIAAGLSIVIDSVHTSIPDIEERLPQYSQELLSKIDLDRWWFLLGIVLSVFLLLLVLSIAFSIVKFHRFRLWIKPRNLHVQFGLVSRIDADVPTRRIQTLSQRRTLLHRLFGKVSVSLETVGGNADESYGLQIKWLAPILTERDWPALLSLLHPDIQWSNFKWQGISSRAWWRLARRNSVLLLLTAVFLSFALGSHMLFLLVALPLIVFHARKKASSIAFASDDRFLVIQSGWPNRWISVVRLEKVQSLSLDHSPFDRFWQMSAISIDTAGARPRGHRLVLPYMDQGEAEALHQKLAAKVSRARFTW